jgi:hypothetical protein
MDHGKAAAVRKVMTQPTQRYKGCLASRLQPADYEHCLDNFDDEQLYFIIINRFLLLLLFLLSLLSMGWVTTASAPGAYAGFRTRLFNTNSNQTEVSSRPSINSWHPSSYHVRSNLQLAQNVRIYSRGSCSFFTHSLPTHPLGFKPTISSSIVDASMLSHNYDKNELPPNEHIRS